jgi:pimeloyl-ACP methyl ester carboxylesterase/ketosteroid isomerase-like protein
VVLVAVSASAQLPEGIATRGVEIWSDGTRLAGDLFWPESLKEGDKLPAIVMCGGWGTLKAHNNGMAPYYAAQGYFVLTFDYRGWGVSDGRLVAVGEIPEPGPDGTVTVKATEIRDLVSPVERIEDIRAAISWLELEPGVDIDKIGLWGTSFGGGNVVAVAALDKRVKAVCSQVGDVNARNGILIGLGMMIARYPKAEGTSEELAARYKEVTARMSERARVVDEHLNNDTIAFDWWIDPLNSKGLLVVTEKGAADPAIKALVEEDNRDRTTFYTILANDPDQIDAAVLHRRAQRARGLIDPFPQGKGLGTNPGLSGIGQISCPVQIIEAGNEELMNIEMMGGALFKALDGRVPVERHVFPDITHFEIYRMPAVGEAIRLQIQWFNKHLKAKASEESGELEKVAQVMERMEVAGAAKDLDAYMEHFSDDFTSHHHFDKAGFREFLAQGWQELEWQSSYDPTKVTIDGDTAKLTMMSTSGMGTFPVPITFKKEADGVWRVISQE